MCINSLKEVINSSNNIVFFGGAGVSTESSIPDFRSEAGLYKASNNKSYSPEEMLSHSFFVNHKEDFFTFYREKMIYADAEPNAAHYALAKLEELGKLKAVITQNIDGLHQKAGSKNVLELHGSVHRNYCMNCGAKYNLNFVINSKDLVPKCTVCCGTVRPNVVLYEESLDNRVIEMALDYLSKPEVLIVGGTSLVVYPAAGLIRYFKGKTLALINKSSTQYDTQADIIINDSIGKVLGEIV
jgi:NAD-dependent deacetylase